MRGLTAKGGGGGSGQYDYTTVQIDTFALSMYLVAVLVILGVYWGIRKLIRMINYTSVFVVAGLVVSSVSYADWAAFNRDYVTAYNALNATSGCVQDFKNNYPGWSVRMNVSVGGLCPQGCQSSGGYGITFSFSPNGSAWYTLYCGEWYGNVFEGSSSTLVKHYMGVYQPNRMFTVSQEGCNYNASFVVNRGEAFDMLNGFDNSVVSGLNSSVVSQGRLVGVKELGGGVGYQYIWVDMCSGELFWTCNGTCDGAVDPVVYWDGETIPTPSPVASPIPSPVASPIPSPVASPIPSPVASPVPSPVVSPVSSPVVRSVPSPSFNPTSYPVAVPTSTDGSKYIDTNIDDIEFDSSVPDVGQDSAVDDTWLDNVFSLFSNHPFLSAVSGSALTFSNETCSMSVDMYGKTIEIGFCELVTYVDSIGYFVVVCATIFSYFIIFRVR